jgi:hypothetical protein
MDRKLVLGIVVVIALAVVGGWYWFMMRPVADVETAPETEDAARPEADAELSITGAWRSADDARFVREFRADGTVEDRYEGDEGATVSGAWNVVADPASEQAELPSAEGMRVVKIQFPEEVLYFSVVNVTDTELELSYLGRGNTLRFTRIR